MKGLDDHIHKEDAVHFQPARETPASWLRWSTFQPAKLVHFSTGLDTALADQGLEPEADSSRE